MGCMQGRMRTALEYLSLVPGEATVETAVLRDRIYRSGAPGVAEAAPQVLPTAPKTPLLCMQKARPHPLSTASRSACLGTIGLHARCPGRARDSLCRLCSSDAKDRSQVTPYHLLKMGIVCELRSFDTVWDACPQPPFPFISEEVPVAVQPQPVQPQSQVQQPGGYSAQQVPAPAGKATLALQLF